MLGPSEAQEVEQWEASASAMLRRLDVVLLTLQGVAVERDPRQETGGMTPHATILGIVTPQHITTHTWNKFKQTLFKSE